MLGIDPILASVIALPAFYLLGAGVYQVYYVAFERRGDEALRGLAFFFGLLFITEVTLVLVFGVDYRLVEAPYIGPSLHLGDCRSAAAAAGAVPGLAGHGRRAAAVHVAHLHRPRDPGGGAGPAGAAADGGQPDADQAHRVRAVDRDRLDRRRDADRDPAGRAVDRARLYRPRVRHLRAGRHGQLRRHAWSRR